MPKRRSTTAHPTLQRDIEALRDVIQRGIPWLPREQHRDAGRHLSVEQKALLGHLTPFRTAAYFITEINVKTIEVARKALAGDIA